MDKPSLDTIPPELRLTIFELACPHPSESIHFNDLDNYTALLRTCQLFRREAQSIFDTNNITKIALQFDEVGNPQCSLFHVRRAILHGKLRNLNTVDCYFPQGTGKGGKSSAAVMVRGFLFVRSVDRGEVGNLPDGTIIRRIEGTV